MKRRAFTLMAGGAAWPLIASAQQPPKILRIRTVSGQPRSSPLWQAFFQRMSELGYHEGRTFSLDHIRAEKPEDYERLYRRPDDAPVDMIVAPGPEIALKGALAAPGEAPILMIAIDYDPLETGFVKSLARPGGRATGVFLQQIEIGVKRLQLLKDAFPDAPGMTVFWDELSAGQWAAVEAASAELGISVFGVKLRRQPYDLERALAEAPAECRGVLLVMTTLFLFRDRTRLAEVAVRNRTILMGFTREMAEAGATMSYGANIRSMFARAADYVDRIVKGAKPGDLPIEQPTTFELVVNLKTAKAIGVTLPPLLLARADEVIE